MKVIDEIINQNWKYLCEYIGKKYVPEHYELQFEYETDARDIYPQRLSLITLALQKLRREF